MAGRRQPCKQTVQHRAAEGVAPRVVEDNEQERRALMQLLKSEGFTVFGAESADKAISYVDENINVVLSDLHMGDVSGIDLCAKIRESEPNLPVLVCTGCTDPEESAELLRLGIRGYFAKPIPMEELLAEMRRVVAA